jgi:hypothetical protein
MQFSTTEARPGFALVLGLAAGLVLEISQGVFTPLLDRNSDMIVPILLPRRLAY